VNINSVDKLFLHSPIKKVLYCMQVKR
jgi:hypothetical protein